MTTSRLSRSLRVRLVLLVAVVAAAVIAIENYLETRTFQRTAQEDRLLAAAATARAVADDIELRDGFDAPREIQTLLHQFLDATPTLRDIAVLKREGDALVLFARTSSAPSDDILATARLALERRELTWGGTGRERSVHAPIAQGKDVVGVVTVRLSLTAVEQLSARGREVTLWFAVPAILLITLLLTGLVQRFVHRPIDLIRQTMARAGAGDTTARVEIARRDEIGDVAEGLNDMLERLESFQADLQARVDHATGELRETNAKLVDSYQRVFALREALVRAEQMAAIGQLAANVAHQIGTPLNLVSGYVQVMKEEARHTPAALHRLQMLETQIRKVSDAIRTMLEHARRPVLQPETIDMAILVREVCEIARPALHAANVELALDMRGPLPSISADSKQLELALFNLVSNSLDAMPTGGRLDIILAGEDHGIRLVVADSGTGIPPDVLPRIFEPWVTTKPAGRGTGLGLSITRDTITAHGGTIEVSSDQGLGTVFTIGLPVAGPVAHSAKAVAG
jgi:signal transduction histidine kinase